MAGVGSAGSGRRVDLAVDLRVGGRPLGAADLEGSALGPVEGLGWHRPVPVLIWRRLRIPPISYPRLSQSAPRGLAAGEFPRFTDPCSRTGGQLESDRGHFFFQLRIGSLDSSAGFSCGWKSRGPRRFLGSISVDRSGHDASHQPRRSRHPRMGLRRGVGAAQGACRSARLSR